MNSEPVRLFDDPSAAAALRADVAHAAAGAVEGLDLAAGAAGLRAAIAADVAAAGGTTAATAAAGSGAAAASGSGVMKAVLALGLVAGGATAWWTSSPKSDTNSAVVAAAPASAAVPTAPVEPATVAPVVATPAVVAPPEPEPEGVPEPVPEPAAEEPVAEERARPVREKHARGHKRAPSAEAAPSKADDHLKEARLVAEARRSLHTQPKHALELLKEAKRDFPKGMLKEEVEALSILALVELGRDAAAAPRAKAFLEQHSKGPYAAAVRRATATSDE